MNDPFMWNSVRHLRQHGRLWIVCAVILLGWPGSPGHAKQKPRVTAPQNQATPPKAAPAPKDELHETDERVFGDYTLRIAHVLNDQGSRGTFEVLQNGQKIYSRNGHRFAFGHVYSDEPTLDNELVAIGKDITGNGVPNLVVSEWSGGAHCCFVFHVYELGPSFREVAVIEAGHGDFSHFANVDGVDGLEFVTADWTFANWRTGFAQSPAPRVVLRFKDGAYTLASDLMAKPKPSPESLQAEARQVRSDPAWSQKEQPPVLWDVMLRLIYGGNGSLAREFLDKAWPLTISGKEAFYQDFRNTLSQSPYYKGIVDLNKGTLN
ncbi:MAG: hypothetical protein AB9873_00550 [Syntrophobacteraceae bacterium]